jgi:hypothetical protein
MTIKRRWLRVLFLMMMAGASVFPGLYMNPKEIEDLLHIMNETKVEFTIPDAGDGSDGYPPWKEFGCVPTERDHVPGNGDTPADKN